MSDTVKRLRGFEALLANEDADLLVEVADEIERLREALRKIATLAAMTEADSARSMRAIASRALASATETTEGGG